MRTSEQLACVCNGEAEVVELGVAEVSEEDNKTAQPTPISSATEAVAGPMWLTAVMVLCSTSKTISAKYNPHCGCVANVGQ